MNFSVTDLPVLLSSPGPFAGTPAMIIGALREEKTALMRTLYKVFLSLPQGIFKMRFHFTCSVRSSPLARFKEKVRHVLMDTTSFVCRKTCPLTCSKLFWLMLLRLDFVLRSLVCVCVGFNF